MGPMREVVVTGLGLVLPDAATPEGFWSLLASGHSAIAPIDRFPTGGYPNPAAGMVGDVVEKAAFTSFPKRLRKRMDRFCQLAMSAAGSAIDDAGLDESLNTHRTGVYLGNMFGGWDVTEPSMRGLCKQGYTGVSPYVASAWFPTAPQGQISIHWGLKGFSKTAVADTASSAVAIGYAAAAIADGRADVMLAGGAEAPVTPYTYTFCATSDRLSPGTYRPFDERADGMQVGEGAVVLVLEAAEAARARGARVHGRLAGFATRHTREDEVFGPAGADAIAGTIRAALDASGVDTVDAVLLDGQGFADADNAELTAVRAVLGTVPASTAKPATGHLLGAAPAVDTAAALLAMRHGLIPPTTGCERPVDPMIVTNAPLERDVRSALLVSRGADGTLAATVLRSE